MSDSEEPPDNTRRPKSTMLPIRRTLLGVVMKENGMNDYSNSSDSHKSTKTSSARSSHSRQSEQSDERNRSGRDLKFDVDSEDEELTERSDAAGGDIVLDLDETQEDYLEDEEERLQPPSKKGRFKGMLLMKQPFYKAMNAFSPSGRPIRNRIPPVRWWLGEEPLYKRQGDGEVVLEGVTDVYITDKVFMKYRTANCDGVTFEGITSSEFDDANCLLVSCEPTCQFNGPSEHSSGVLSVLIHRIRNDTTTLSPSTTKSRFVPEVRAALTPFWVLAVAIGVAAICVGLNVTLCVAYCCYCRRKKRSQKAHISTVKGGPTLHAYNQQI
ncbi:unnamed protein product [Caenorhabditis sp. 36 PRJEB53466]|nr:unnamed protein product [Caenorhabditis sp. 36 PRJEB53466]